MTQVDWRGVYPAALTHFNDDHRVDYNLTADHLKNLLDAGIHGLVMLGTCGENNSLEPEEKNLLLKTAQQTVRGKVPILAGVSELTTAKAIQFIAESEGLVDGFMVLPAMAYKSDERETMTHYQSIARSTASPIMIYNNPISYSVDITVEQLKVLSSEKNIVAVKESCDDPRRITDIYNELGRRFIVFSGVDDLALESLLLGAEGWISGLVNAFPCENRLLWDLIQEENWKEALDVYRWYTPCLHLDSKVKLVQYIKLAAWQCGYGNENVRPPRLKLEGAEREETLRLVKKAMETRPNPAGIRLKQRVNPVKVRN